MDMYNLPKKYAKDSLIMIFFKTEKIDPLF